MTNRSSPSGANAHHGPRRARRGSVLCAPTQAGVAQLAERQPSKLNVASSNLVSRSNTLRFAVEDPGSDDAQWCVQQYFAELNARFNTGFDPALSISADVAELTPPGGLFLIARVDGRPIGCGALKFHPGAPAELKRMWVAPDARGLGLGRRLLFELEDQARAAGVEVLHLETNETLAEAIALYRKSGFDEVPAFNSEPYAHHWFEKQLTSP